jgi:hypothetical protein
MLGGYPLLGLDWPACLRQLCLAHSLKFLTDFVKPVSTPDKVAHKLHVFHGTRHAVACQIQKYDPVLQKYRRLLPPF